MSSSKFSNINCTNFGKLSDDINIDMNDICELLKYDGRISGCSFESTIKNFNSNFANKVDISEIKSAKAIIILWIIHPDISIAIIGDMMEVCNELISDDCEVIMATHTLSAIAQNAVEMKIIMSGLD